MASKADKIKIAGTSADRRSKLTIEQKKEIRGLYTSGGYSQKDLAIKFLVSKRTIQFILSPEKLEQNKQRRAERGGSSIYYDREKHRKSIADSRAYKLSLKL